MLNLLRNKNKNFLFAIGSGMILLVLGCGSPRFDINTEEGRQAIKDEVLNALSNEECERAIELIEPLYNSSHSDNEIRTLRASAHACNTGIDFFKFLSNLIQNKTSLGATNGAFWVTMTKLFPSNFDKHDLQSAWLSTDALVAILKSGIVVPESYQINSGSNNVGSVLANDRTSDANALLLFVSMAAIGETQNRWGMNDSKSPSSDGHKQKNLPWTRENIVGEEACGYAGAVINMLDAAESMSTTNTNLSTVLTAVKTIKGGIGSACELGCVGAAGGGYNTGCALTAGDCTTLGNCSNPGNPTACLTACPLKIRDRKGCMDTQKARCAAAGIVNFVNTGSGW